jgi:hypothetical protein
VSRDWGWGSGPPVRWRSWPFPLEFPHLWPQGKNLETQIGPGSEECAHSREHCQREIDRGPRCITDCKRQITHCSIRTLVTDFESPID